MSATNTRQENVPVPPIIDPFFENAAELRYSLAFNSDDYEFASRSGRIVYLVDANIVRFFLNPEEERHRMHVFGPGEGDTYAGATALIAAEFLFSRGLAGQGDSPALIAPAHGEDLQGILGALIEAARREMDAPANNLNPTLRTQIHRLVEGARDGTLPRDQVVRDLSVLVPSAAKQLLAGPAGAMAQIARLHDEDLLRPMALHTATTKEIMTLDTQGRSRARMWEDLLRKQYIMLGRSINDHVRSLISHDAEVLTQLQMLSDASDQNTTRYVLITADRAMYDTYASWFWSEANDPEKSPFLLRSLLQYAPILNVQEMPNGIERSDLLVRARVALDGILHGYREVDRTGYPRRLVLARGLARGGVVKTLTSLYGYNPLQVRPQDEPLVKEAQRLWRRAFRASIVVNAELMKRRLRAEIELVADLLREQSDLRTALIAVTEDVLGRAERAQLNLNARVNLKLLIDQRSGVQQAARADLPVAIEFPSITGKIPLNRVVDRLAENDASLLSRVTAALGKADDDEAFLFTACLALRCGRWYSAWHHATRALTLLGDRATAESRRTDASILVALTARYALPSAEALSQAFSLLEQLAARARVRNEHALLARVLAEHLALTLTLYYANRLAGRLPKISLPPLPSIQNWGTLLREAEEAAEKAKAEQVLEQLAVNVVAAALLARRLQPDLAQMMDPSDAVLDGALTRVDPLLRDPDCPLVLRAEVALLRGEPMEPIAQALTSSEPMLTELDRAEINEFCENAG